MINFKNWGIVGYNDNTGLGCQNRDIKKVLGITNHLIIQSEKLTNNYFCEKTDFLLNNETPKKDIENKIRDLEGLIFVENPGWHPHVLTTAKKYKVKTLCIVNWEWFNPNGSDWRKVDCLIAPTKYTENILAKFGFQNSIYLENPIDLKILPLRQVRGYPKTFVHNAGIVDHDDRKSTYQVVKSFENIILKDLKLIINTQKKLDIEVKDKRIEIRIGDKPSKNELYNEGDVLIQPSKMEGLGLSILEGVCSGLPVITTNHPPMNQWVWHRDLQVSTQIFKRKSFSNKSAGIKHAFLKIPSTKSLTKVIEWCANNKMDYFSNENRKWAQQNFEESIIKKKWNILLNNFFDA